ncbi:unnamed protein product [Gadus morhua 'NCC']
MQDSSSGRLLQTEPVVRPARHSHADMLTEREVLPLRPSTFQSLQRLGGRPCVQSPSAGGQRSASLQGPIPPPPDLYPRRREDPGTASKHPLCLGLEVLERTGPSYRPAPTTALSGFVSRSYLRRSGDPVFRGRAGN